MIPACNQIGWVLVSVQREIELILGWDSRSEENHGERSSCVLLSEQIHTCQSEI